MCSNSWKDCVGMTKVLLRGLFVILITLCEELGHIKLKVKFFINTCINIRMLLLKANNF